MSRNRFRMIARPQESTHMDRTAIPEPLGPVLRPKIGQKVHVLRWWWGAMWHTLTYSSVLAEAYVALQAPRFKAMQRAETATAFA